jgi:hypothetical protein
VEIRFHYGCLLDKRLRTAETELLMMESMAWISSSGASHNFIDVDLHAVQVDDHIRLQQNEQWRMM